jgi:hypothetical protein
MGAMRAQVNMTYDLPQHQAMFLDGKFLRRRFGPEQTSLSAVMKSGKTPKGKQTFCSLLREWYGIQHFQLAFRLWVGAAVDDTFFYSLYFRA